MAALPLRRLGSGGPELTQVGFGAWAVGGGGWSFGWGEQDDQDSIAAIRRALELGVSWVDTAAVYGLGHSEEVVGRALAGLPATERPHVFTKCGLVWDSARPMEPARRRLAPASIRRECDASLRRLGVEAIDLYQFHWPDESGVPVEESWGAMLQLRAEGKVRWCGVSNFDVSLLERCERLGHVDSLQPPFSLINRQTAAELFPWCAAHGTGVIVYSPMQSGLLTDSFTAARPQWPSTTGGGPVPTSPLRAWRATWRSGTRSGLWPPAMASRSRRWRWPGCSALAPSPRPSWGPALLPRSRDGSRPPGSP
jgi:aryl-alcohol dehydrogenase-like predicted oxidoreductase